MFNMGPPALARVTIRMRMVVSLDAAAVNTIPYGAWPDRSLEQRSRGARQRRGRRGWGGWRPRAGGKRPRPRWGGQALGEGRVVPAPLAAGGCQERVVFDYS